MHKNDQILEFLEKWGACIAYILVGLIGKIGWDIVNNRKLNFWYVFGTGCIGSCIGYLSYMWCEQHPTANAGLIVPISTLISRDIMLFINVVDWQKILTMFFKRGGKDLE